jgi:hypothetical protein
MIIGRASVFNNHGYVLFVIITILTFHHSWLITIFSNQRLSRACMVHLVIKKNQLVLCKNYVLQW